MDNCVFVITHKEFCVPVLPQYVPLLVGAVDKNPRLRSMYQCDDEGENISSRNNSYCELTGLYWMWKNVHSRNIGLVHYRRYFAKIYSIGKIKYMYFVLNHKNAYKILDTNKLEQKLGRHQLIVKKSRHYKDGARKVILQSIKEEDLQLLEDVIQNEYSSYYTTYLYWINNTFLINCNMFFGDKNIIDKYCEWLFPLLHRADELHKEKNGNYYKNRELGYFGELLFGIWLKKNNIDYVFEDVVNTEECDKADCIIDIKDLVRKAKKHLIR